MTGVVDLWTLGWCCCQTRDETSDKLKAVRRESSQARNGPEWAQAHGGTGHQVPSTGSTGRLWQGTTALGPGAPGRTWPLTRPRGVSAGTTCSTAGTAG